MLKNSFYLFSKKKIKLKLINKFFYVTTKNIPQFKKISIDINQKSTNINIIAMHLLALEALIGKKAIIAKKKILKTNNFNIKKNASLNVKIAISKNNIHNIALKIMTSVFFNKKNEKQFYAKKINFNSLSFQSIDSLNFDVFENSFKIFQKLKALNITYTTNSKSFKETLFIFKFYKILFL